MSKRAISDVSAIDNLDETSSALCDFEVQCFTTELADGSNTAACLLHMTLSNYFLPPNELSPISD